MTVKDARRLDEQDHRALVLWATDCAAHVLAYFEAQYPHDDRPRQAIAAGRAWVRGEIGMREARAAARAADHAAARAAARAAGHAAATAHVAGHARHAASYAVTVASYAAVPTDATAVIAAERAWQERHLLEHLRSGALPVRGTSNAWKHDAPPERSSR